MIKIIIADDEPIITAGIRKLVDWNELGVEIVGQYMDGKSALEGIIEHRPDIALLDISMPKMTGVEVLKECRLLGLPSQIIFISGFQDFEYAKAGIRYGAVDYLLKPIVRNELLAAIGKSISQLEEKLLKPSNGEEKNTDDYRKLLPLEEAKYLPAYVEILQHEEKNPPMEKLVRFSVVSFIEEYLEKQDQGIIFTKNDDIVIVLKGMEQGEGKETANRIRKEVFGHMGCSLGMVIGKAVDHISQIPDMFQKCLYLKEYFFFADQMENPVLLVGEAVFPFPENTEYFLKVRSQMTDMIIAQDEKNFTKCFERFARILCNMAEGKKEDVFFYFCSAVKALNEKFQNLALPCPDYDEKELLHKGRVCKNYRELQEKFYGIMEEYYDKIKATVVDNNNKNFLKAKIYIDKHYDEDITLEVLAKEIHMNPYYFSTFFKKNAGENFKDYVSRVRVQHAVSLLVSTDMKAYEIALKVGFSDTRAFSDNFQRIYHETPIAYRKRVKGGESK